MKRVLFVISILLGFHSASAQFHANIELGGSNYTGLALTVEYEFGLNNSPYYLTPKLGWGQIIWWDNAMTLQSGLAFGKELKNNNDLQISSNLSYLTQGPFTTSPFHDEGLPGKGRGDAREAGNFLMFHSIDYRLKKEKINWTFGLGVLMYFSRVGPDGHFMTYDPAPMAKIGIGI